MIHIKYIDSLEEINRLGSALTWIGLNIDETNLENMFKWITTYTSIKRKIVYIIEGKTLNVLFDLNDHFDDNLHIVCVDLNDMEDYQKIILSRLDVDGHWLDDFISNIR